MPIVVLPDTVQVGDVSIPYTVTAGRKGCVRLRFANHRLMIETGTGKLTPNAEQFLHRKATWLVRYYNHQQAATAQRDVFLANLLRQTQVLGRTYPIEYVAGPKYHYALLQDRLRLIVPQGKLGNAKAVLEGALRAMAADYLKPRLQHWATKMGLAFNRVVIKDHRSKWGSCSSKQNINLNWHLIMLPEALIDYILIHELCHLRELNHSPAFWAHVEATCPNYKALDRQMNQHQWLIGIFD